MPQAPLSILESGMVCGVGLTAPAACAAIRCSLDNFQETKFIDQHGEWVVGSPVPLARPWHGRIKLVKMLAMAVSECLRDRKPADLGQIPLILCLAEHERQGRFSRLEYLRQDLETEIRASFHSDSGLVAQGRVSAFTALAHARELIYQKRFPFVVIAGVDSYLVAATLADLDKGKRLKTSQNSNGLIPGEAAAAILVGPPVSGAQQLLCTGLGFGTEEANVSAGLPLRANGLTQAIKGALTEANCALADLSFRIADTSGEQYYFKEAALALLRTLRGRKEHFYLWHPADCIGEVGAAAGLAMLSVIVEASRKRYSHGPGVLAHAGNDAGQRGAAILQWVH